MKQKVIPGFRALFGESTQTYEQVLSEMPSTVVLYIATFINNELAAPLDYRNNQHRILKLLQRGFTATQNELLDFNLTRLTNFGYGEDATELFHRRYLTAMMVREIKRNATSPVYVPANGKDFEFLLAYLLIIDEENDKSRKTLDISLQQQGEPFADYRLIWTPNINQYQFNESVSPAFELFKLFCLLKYGMEHWRPYLKNYLSQLGLSTIGQLADSYKKIFMATIHYNPDVDFSKCADISPNLDANVKHLESLSVNQQMGNQKITLLNLKKQPLLKIDNNKYRVADINFFYNHIYKGSFFDLFHKTGLEKEISFNKYSSDVSKKVVEEICFVSILKTLYNSKGVLHFDDGTSTIPDGYFRDENVIFLFEFKAYILKDELTETPNFDNLKKYVDENFIENNNGKPKGVGQLINQISNIQNKKYSFDSYLNQNNNACYTIYPIICHTDFHFSLPGINEYVNNQFKQKLDSSVRTYFNIKNTTFINLGCLFDLSLRKGTFSILSTQIDQYWTMLNEKKELFSKWFNSDIYLSSKSSFDEIYQCHFLNGLPSVQEGKDNFQSILNNAGINQELSNEIV